MRSTADAHLPSQRKLQLSAVQRSRWQANGGRDIEGFLATGAVALVDAAFLCAEADKNAVLRHRQALPDEAFLSLDEVIAAVQAAPFLPIIVISAPWLHPAHPDPLGENLQRLATALRHYTANGVDRWGVCWYFSSLHMHPDEANGELRNVAEEALYQEGLNGIGMLLAHRATTVFQLTTNPDGYPLRYSLPASFPGWSKYHALGWPWTECVLAGLTKDSQFLLDLGRLTASRLNSLSGRHGLVRECKLRGRLERPAPLLPSHFEEIVGAKQYDKTREHADLAVLSRLYATTFRDTFRTVTRLDYSEMGWKDDEAIRLSKLLVGGHTPQLQELILRGNEIGDVGGSTLLRLLSSAWAADADSLPRSLRLIDLSSNRIGASGMAIIARCSQRMPTLAVHIHLHNNAAPGELKTAFAHGTTAPSQVAEICHAVRQAEEQMQSHRIGVEYARREQKVAASAAAGLKTYAELKSSMGGEGGTRRRLRPHRLVETSSETASRLALAVHEQTKRLLVASTHDAVERARELKGRLDDRDVFAPVVNEIRALHEMRVSVRGRHLSLVDDQASVRRRHAKAVAAEHIREDERQERAAAGSSKGRSMCTIVDPAASASASAAKTAAESQRGRGMSSRPANVVVRHLSLLGGRSAQNLQRGELLAGRIELLNKGLRNPPSTMPSDRVGFAAPPHRAAPLATSHRVAPSAHSGTSSVLHPPLHRPPPSAVISSAAATQHPRSVTGVNTQAASTGAPQPPPPRLRASRSAPSIVTAIAQRFPLRKAGVTAGERAMAFY